MKTKKNRYVLSARGLALRKRIIRTRRRAICVGLLYLLGIIAFTGVVAALPLLNHDLAPLGVMEFWKVFTEIDLKTADGTIKLLNAVLYTVMLIWLVVNVFKAFGKFGWLFKRITNKVSKRYGFNHSVYAMEDMGGIFSVSFSVTLFGYFLIALLCGDVANKDCVSIVLPILLGVGILIRLGAGVIGAKASYYYYDIRKACIIEIRRVIGRFAPFFRNLLQLASIMGIMYFLLKSNGEKPLISSMFGEGNLQNFFKQDMWVLIWIFAQWLAIICLTVLVKHATATTEYNINGPYGYGMRYFRWFSFFVFLCAGGAVAVRYFMGDGELNKNVLIVAVIALVMLIVELIMHRCPKQPGEKRVKKEKVVEVDDDLVEVSFNTAAHSYVSSYIDPPRTNPTMKGDPMATA